MMVGHAALAFALAALVATWLDVSADRALLVGAVAGAFAVTPDFDMGYAFVSLVTADTLALSALQNTFWETGLVVHRGMTHSLVVGGVTALGFGLLAYPRLGRAAGAVGLAGLVAATLALVGPLEAAVMASFVAAGTGVTAGALWLGLAPRTILGTAFLGVLTHPFGDMFTGTAPVLLYPFEGRHLPELVVLFEEPTLHLLGAFGIELATIWAALLVFLWLQDRPVRRHIHHRAVVGVTYGAAVLALPPPTLDVSYHFVFSVLAVGSVGATVDLPLPTLRERETQYTVVLTALTAITLAWASYAIVYAVSQSTIL
jgi:membrane-bound metal-dependent hydrolase YbcI (DUF457 family)